MNGDGILGSIAAWHRNHGGLTEIVPAENVLAGELVPGMSLPAVAYREASIRTDGRSSMSTWRTIAVAVEAEAVDAPTLEALAEALESAMTGWHNDLYQSLGPPTVEATIARRPDGPSEHFRANLRISWRAVLK